jgi:hypothetical protein
MSALYTAIHRRCDAIDAGVDVAAVLYIDALYVVVIS